MEDIEYDTSACQLRVKGRNIQENQYVKVSREGRRGRKERGRRERRERGRKEEDVGTFSCPAQGNSTSLLQCPQSVLKA